MRARAIIDQSKYIQQINSIQDFIDNHLECNLTLEQLAQQVHYSPYYFHRLFRFMVGESLYQYTSRIRLEKAAFLLASDKSMSITDVGIAVGFDSLAGFAKAFKKRYGMNAKAFREADITMNKYKYRRLAATDMSRLPRPYKVEIQHIPARNVAYIRYIGSHQGNSELYQQLFYQLYEWANQRHLITPESKWMTLYHDQTDMTEDDKLRLSVCLEVPPTIQPDDTVGVMTIQACQYAIGCFELATEEYQQAWDYMLFDWLLDSGYTMENQIVYEAYPLVESSKPNKRVVHICVPVKKL